MTRRKVAFAVLASIVVTFAYVRQSEVSGRLAQDLWYDDVSYVVDASRRLEVAYQQGIWPFVRTFVAEPPHSPLVTLVATVGLGIFGFQDNAVYLASALMLALMAILLLHVFRDDDPWVGALAVAVLLVSPLGYRTVTEFRTDTANGFVTSAFALLFLTAIFRDRPEDARLGGVLFGVALLTKPTFLPHTLAVALGVVGVWAVERRRGGASALPARELARWLGVGVAIALPYYVVAWRSLFAYFWQNSYGTGGKVWRFPESYSALEVARRMAFARGIEMKMVGYTRDAAALVLAASAAHLAWRRSWRALAPSALMVAVALGSLAVVVFGRMDAEFYSATFHFAVVIASFVALAASLREAGPWRRGATVVAVIAVHAVAVAWNSGIHAFHVSPDARRGHSWNGALVDAVRRDLASRGGAGNPERGVSVMLTAISGVCIQSLEWTARKEGFRASFSDHHRAETAGEVLAEARRAAYVVVPNPEKAELLQLFPAARFQDRVLADLRSDPAFEPVPAGFDDEADRFLVFRNGPVLEADGPVFPAPLDARSGFLPEEGPYPDWKLPRVRWLVAPRGSVCISGRVPPDASVRASFRAAVAGRLTVAHGGRILAGFDVSASERFQDVSIPLGALPEAPCLELAFSGGPAPESRLVLFQRFRVDRASPADRRLPLRR